jgi:hypothetical protein
MICHASEQLKTLKKKVSVKSNSCRTPSHPPRKYQPFLSFVSTNVYPRLVFLNFAVLYCFSAMNSIPDPPPQPQRLAAALVPFSVGESTAVEKRQRGRGEEAKMKCSVEKLRNRLQVFWKNDQKRG